MVMEKLAKDSIRVMTKPKVSCNIFTGYILDIAAEQASASINLVVQHQ